MMTTMMMMMMRSSFGSGFYQWKSHLMNSQRRRDMHVVCVGMGIGSFPVTMSYFRLLAAYKRRKQRARSPNRKHAPAMHWES
jgi:hypothetical protein